MTNAQDISSKQAHHNSVQPVTRVPSNFGWKWNTVEIRSEIWAGWPWDVVGREENHYLDVIERVGKVKTAVEAAEAEEAEVPRAAENHHGAFHMREPGVEAYDTPPQTVSLDVYYPELPQLDPSSGASFLTIPDEEVPELADANTEDEGITEVVEPSFSTAAQDEETVRVEDDAGDKSIQNPPPGAALTSSESASGSRRR
ncbi:hypothetical protein SNOG_05093 [Parastagonospora nodorum SN15]|uniref:Uncharacterized protein n=1 Tax=Phaeosphaeria nodorum (strain SN15 / ATCC MYA-4574 / FGSC 10173) TaxID=321614 RepID=Q0UT21_PHANO|nr:hypothetical protein SNOG_05093 [Parastagonospora nodorum SN15]KAH3942613.1 hypothetical protein HBH53_183020 [Parastagonospora nodorum]EAT87484.1 hypothetical protein SNOG_05093 [Parastagonospora nodorum SN15]KAH3997399.1 hypothetical protein HBI10_142210 [Parastagonospora nodorum]KAH4021035.1 hypothetical protein HBI13_110510 [Parastagonospora nodorum]KAH4067401.1 hypothetical protein HBH50_139740 [Parastagonospora nodorum]